MPLEQKLSAAAFPEFQNKHQSILEDLVKRYNFTFDFYRSMLNKQAQVENDLFPVSTFRVSISRTSEKKCQDGFSKYLSENAKNSSKCFEGLYVPGENADLGHFFENENFVNFPSKETKSYYSLLNLQSGVVDELNSWEYATAAYNKILFMEGKTLSDEVRFL